MNVLGAFAEAWVCLCGGSTVPYDDDCGGVLESDGLPKLEGCITPGGDTLGRAPCKDDMGGNCIHGTPSTKALTNVIVKNIS